MTPELEMLQKYGYVVVRNVISQTVLEVMRREARRILRDRGSDTMRPNDLLASAALTEALFSTDMRGVINRLFGPELDLYLYPNFTIRNNLYINWHTDDFFLEAPLEAASDLPAFYMFNVYLQENSPEAGGGLDVQAGTHRLSRQQRSLLAESTGPASEHLIPSNAGDLVVFDYRVVHRGTMPAGAGRADRMALQWTLSTSDQVAQVYLKYLRKRANQKMHISDYTKHRAQAFFDDLPNVLADDFVARFTPAFFDDRLHFVEMKKYLGQASQ